jgi:hypothetical protein
MGTNTPGGEQMITVDEISARWMGHGVLEVAPDELLRSFRRVEDVLGREWLEATLHSGARGPAITLPVHVLGSDLVAVENAINTEALVNRLKANDKAARSEHAALAMCVRGPEITVEIEPTISVGGGTKVPDFRVRGPEDDWTHVEVTAPNCSASQRSAQRAVDSLVSSTGLRDGVSVQVRFRREPTPGDIQLVTRETACINSDRGTKDTEYWVLCVLPVSPVISLIGCDEQDRPVVGAAAARSEGG